MSHRPPVLLVGVTLGDYLLWHWSLSANHDVLALISGLTLPPLAVACLWLLALSVARLLARATRLPRRRREAAPARRAQPVVRAADATLEREAIAAAAADSAGNPRKLAA